jgi:hypothetical protein
LLKVPSLHLRLLEGFIAVTYAEHASPADRGRQSVLETSRGAGTAERQALSAAILMVKERNRNGEALAPVIYTTDANIDPKSKIESQLASLSAKVQAYEDVISKLSNRFGVSDEQLVNIALAVVWNPTRLH